MEHTKVLTFASTALKNLFKAPATTKYPFVAREYPERVRGHVELDTATCVGCGMCMRSCPSGAINVNRADASWSISRFDCVQCGNCVNMCPKKCLAIVAGYTEPGSEKKTDTYSITIPKPPVKPAAAAGSSAGASAAATAGAGSAASAVSTAAN